MTPVVLSAATDSLAHAGMVTGRITDWAEFASGWHEFYLMAGTAAVTLAGLLFVAISIHVDALVHPSREHLLALARLILFSYVGVLVISLIMLVPALPLRFVAIQLIVAPVPLMVWTVQLARVRHQTEHAEFTGWVLRRRAYVPVLGYLMIMVVGILIRQTRMPAFLYWLVGAIAMLLGNAAGASWDLLVRTAKTRQRAEHTPQT